MAISFLIDLLLRAAEKTLRSVAKFLVAYLVSAILKDKVMTERLAVHHLGYSKSP